MNAYKNERGQSTMEYVLILAAVLGIVLLLIQQVIPKAKQRVNDASTAMQSPSN